MHRHYKIQVTDRALLDLRKLSITSIHVDLRYCLPGCYSQENAQPYIYIHEAIHKMTVMNCIRFVTGWKLDVTGVDPV